MVTLKTFMMVAACVCFIVASCGVGGRINLVAAGLALWTATIVLPV